MLAERISGGETFHRLAHLLIGVLFEDAVEERRIMRMLRFGSEADGALIRRARNSRP